MPTDIDQYDFTGPAYDRTIDLYRQRARDDAAKAKGLERFLFELFGTDLIGSIACAFDPWVRFRFPRYKITPVQRTRGFRCIAAATRQLWSSYDDLTIRTSSYNGDFYESTTGHSGGMSARTSQQEVWGFVKDTTRKTRSLESDLGEFELFKPAFKSSGFSYGRDDFSYVFTTMPGNKSQTYWKNRHYSIGREGPTFYISKYAISSSACNTRAKAAMAKHSLGLVSKSLPTSRRFNLAYQIGELKDLPQTLRGTLAAWRDIESLLGAQLFSKLLRNPGAWTPEYRQILLARRNQLGLEKLDSSASNAYLCYKFGWESMVSSINQLMSKPERVANDVNRLIQRNGLATSFRSSKRWVEKWDSPPNASFDLDGGETLISGPSASGFLECELKCMVNATYSFPELDLPTLRKQIWNHKMGVIPLPSDIFDLVPWTWLVDWFTGLGDYIHVMNELFEDRSLINYGFVTYIEKATSNITVNLRYQSTGSRVIDSQRESWTTRQFVSPTAEYSHKYILRKSLDQVADIKTPSSGNLSTTQKTILSALFGAKNNTWRNGFFR